ncbi:MAG: glycoside hydrolase family 3 C-terminal domain-containing protein [Bacteroidetes bacterium]|nr:glycoside hydrolase family 3 C-terminal domain-containing protein [Bacteroidota bacterium]MBU1114908.1 glycoside hydrolase family 3 C-terminal domain-containing protein [Bacteroidota bacterium]MBU1799382.1 glycoside hydrolase family 3 C-terminal domain-containing protein [Bacteroidota bacterium]
MTKLKTSKYFIILFLFNAVTCFAQTPIYLNPNALTSERVNDLLSRMTLDEKIGQMTQADHKAVGNMEDLKTYFLGSILSGGGSDPTSGNTTLDWANLYDLFQHKAMESRLGIPIIYGIDAVHGNSNVEGATIFPHNIGLGATRNPELVKLATRITAIEIAATGIDWTFAPCVAVPRDERWGRTYEGFGETPELATMFGGSAVNGFQNDSLNSPTSIVACAKHFIGDGGTTSGDDQGNTEISETELRAIHLPGYISAIQNNVKTVMASYSSWNSVKMHGNKYLLTDVLKTELGFDGFIISDWAAIDQLPGDYTSDVETSINAGNDMIMVPNDYKNFFNILKTLVQQGKVSQERIDDAVSRILKVKFELGLFENPYADRALLSEVGSAAHRDIARQCVRESSVLLKKNDNVLPIPKSAVKILVAGEHANNIGLQCGGWTIQWLGASGNITTGTTILDGLKKVAPSAEFVYDANGNFNDTNADYAIVVIGEQPYAEGYGDRVDLSIDKDQINMVRKLNNLGIPVVTVLISGRPMIINPVLHNSDAFIASWLPGTEADGIAEVIMGDYTPKGLLPMTWAKTMNQIPINFGDSEYNPLFAYGFGITSFANSEIGSNPIFQSGMVTEDGMHIELAFNKSMENSGNNSAEFTVVKNGNSFLQIIDFNLSPTDNKIILLELSDKISKGDIVSVSYVSGNLASEDGGTLQSFDLQNVVNYLDYISGLNQLPGKVEAEDFTNMNGIQTEATSDIGGGLNVGWIDAGDWMEYKCNLPNTGEYFVNFRVASETAEGKIRFFIDGIETFSRVIPVTGGWQTWTTVSTITDIESGDFNIKLLAEKGGFNLNWFELVTISDAESENNLPSSYSLYQNYPNPFNPSTKIKYSISTAGNVKLKVYDVLGKEVKSLVNEYKKAGSYEIEFNSVNLSTGIYFYKMTSGSFTATQKMVLVK